MRAFVVEKYGKSGLRAAQVPDPTIGPRDVLVRVSAASINALDKMVRNGEYHQRLQEAAALPGCEHDGGTRGGGISRFGEARGHGRLARRAPGDRGDDPALHAYQGRGGLLGRRGMTPSPGPPRGAIATERLEIVPAAGRSGAVEPSRKVRR